jgi:long-chain acyl-CoA synthetase
MDRSVIGISPGAHVQSWGHLFAVLRCMFPMEVRVLTGDQWSCDGLAGVVDLGGNVVAACAAAAKGVPCFTVVASREKPRSIPTSELRFGASPQLESCLRDQVLVAQDIEGFFPLNPAVGDAVLARKGDHAFWLHRRVGNAGVDLVAMAPPVLSRGSYLQEHFRSGRFARLLPLMQFLVRVTRNLDWQYPPSHACFVFDDPNLFWPTYGCLDFRELAKHAKAHDYYVSVAMVPLDAWWVNRTAAATFRANAPRLSLLMHGCNHTRGELSQSRPTEEWLSLLAQALRRSARLERRYGLELCRVIEPPHRALAKEVFHCLDLLDYEAVLITPEMLPKHNGGVAWPATLGLNPADLLVQGMTAIPRIKMAPDWKTAVVLAAFLRQPILLAGHQQDAADNLAVVEEFAKVVNGLGRVRWTTPRGIARANYRFKIQGDQMTVQMLGRRAEVTVPEGIRQVCVERPWLPPESKEPLALKCRETGLSLQPSAGENGRSWLLPAAGTIAIHSPLACTLPQSAIRQPRPALWPWIRKALVEARDRTYPVRLHMRLATRSVRPAPQLADPHGMKLVQEFLTNSAARQPGKVALVCGDRRWTYAEIDAMSNRLANAFVASGVRRGDRVGIYLSNSVETVAALFAVLKAGGVFVILNRTTKADKLAYILNNCQAVALVLDDRAAGQGLAESLQQRVPSLKTVVLCGAQAEEFCTRHPGFAEFNAIQVASPATAPPVVNTDLDLACLIYTSGTTGEAKGVMCAHENMVFVTGSIVKYLENGEQDIILNVLPLSFTYGLYQVLATFQTGATLVLENSFAYPTTILERMQQEGVTGFAGVPTIYATLLQMNLEAYDLSRLRYLTNAAAALSPAQVLEIHKRFPQAAFFSMYGQTETARTLYLPPQWVAQKPGSVGIAIPGTEVWIADETGRRLPPGTTGELVVRGRHVMRGYWGQPEETARRFRPGPIAGERVCYTGDLFRTDEEGSLYFVSRSDDIIKSRGEKVAPKEVENLLFTLKGVIQAAVVGVPDPILGQAVKAILVVDDGALTATQVLAHCRDHLDDFMVPKHIEFRDALPLTPTGKINRNELI